MHGSTSKSQLYGDSAGKDDRFVRRQRQRMNFVAMVQCLFAPWILFCIVFGITTFNLHYSKPWLCWLLVGIASFLVLIVGVNAWASLQAKWKHEPNEPTWIVFLFITMVIAVAVGVGLGNNVFGNFMQKYYDYLNLNNYNGVNVAKVRGEQLMDAARLKFVNGTTLDLRKAIGFQNSQTYCVAPLTLADSSGVMSELSSYDFWAIGLDCCSGDNKDYHCGEFNNPNARGGLRLLEDFDRAYYRLAVQQAEGMYHIHADHPLFLYWTEDPVAEMESWREDGYKFYYLGMLMHFGWQLICVALAVIGFRKLGSYD